MDIENVVLEIKRSCTVKIGVFFTSCSFSTNNISIWQTEFVPKQTQIFYQRCSRFGSSEEYGHLLDGGPIIQSSESTICFSTLLTSLIHWAEQELILGVCQKILTNLLSICLLFIDIKDSILLLESIIGIVFSCFLG